ncbi:MAG: cobaltochelatase subunit CobN, partial [Phormidesmis sp.]
MHRLAATPGGWNSTTEGVVFIEQTPAPVILLTAADTDIATLSQALPRLPQSFSDIRCMNLLQLQQQLTIDTYTEDVLSYAQLIILRILGGRGYWSYGLEITKATVAETGAVLVVIPGDDRPDLDLMSHSTVPLVVVNRLWRYFTEGGVDNLCNGLLYASDRVFSTQYHPPVPKRIPKIGIYSLPAPDQVPLTTDPAINLTTGSGLGLGALSTENSELNTDTDAKGTELPAKSFRIESLIQKESLSKALNEGKVNKQILQDSEQSVTSGRSPLASVGILFYRAHYLAGNTRVVEAIAAALNRRGLRPVPIYVSALKNTDIQQALLGHCQGHDQTDSAHPVEL